jgi:hypothetical protein
MESRVVPRLNEGEDRRSDLERRVVVSILERVPCFVSRDGHRGHARATRVSEGEANHTRARVVVIGEGSPRQLELDVAESVGIENVTRNLPAA